MTGFAALAPACTAFAVELADAARRLQAEFSAAALDVEVKPDRRFVTALDTRIVAHLRPIIRRRWPGRGRCGEEVAQVPYRMQIEGKIRAPYVHFVPDQPW
jgi:fructose-1,6-bisphosphatase/inositol monophosphatase family enzyme